MDRPSILQTVSGIPANTRIVSDLELTDPVNMEFDHLLSLRFHQSILSCKRSDHNRERADLNSNIVPPTGLFTCCANCRFSSEHRIDRCEYCIGSSSIMRGYPPAKA